MTHLRNQFKDIFGVDALPVLDELMIDKYQTQDDKRPMLLNMESTDREIMQKSKISSLGLFEETGEAESAPLDNFDQSYDKTYTILDYEKAIGISRQMIRDARFNLIQRMVQSLGRSAMETKQILAAGLYNGAFSTTQSFDGVSWINASHPTQAGNQSNTLAAQSDLSYTSLTEAETVFDKFQDERGKRLYIRPRVLLVPSELKHDAAQLVNSPFRPGNANNDINAVNADTDVISWPYLTDTDAWFLQSAPEDHGGRVVEREGLNTDIEEDRLAGILYYVARFAEAYGVDEWRGVVGSDGSA